MSFLQQKQLNQNQSSSNQNSVPIISKVIMYGVKNSQSLSLSSIKKNQIKVGILKSYTYDEQKRQVIDTTEIQQDKYQIWTYPDGIKIYDAEYKIINDPQPEFSFSQPNIIHPQKVIGNIKSTEGIIQPPDNIYSFVLTDYDLNRTYCTCIVWNEKKFVLNDQQKQDFLPAEKLQQTVTLKRNNHKLALQHSKILPKCTLNQLIKDPLVLDPTSSLTYIPKALIICSKYPCLKFERDLITFIYQNAVKKYQEVNIRKKSIDQLKNLIVKYGYPQAQKLFDQQQFLQQTQSRYKKYQKQKQLPIKPSKIHSKKTYERLQRQKHQNQLNISSLRKLQKRKLQQFYLSFAFLPQLNQPKFKDPKIQTQSQIINIEDTINKTGYFKLQPFQYSSTCFKIPNFNIIRTIQKIGIQNIITIWKNCVLERQILIFSLDQFLTIQLFQTLLYLLQPLKWQNIYIPFLPFHLCHHVEALGGYLIGMSKIHMNYMIQHFNLQTKVLIDLDQMIIIQEGGINVLFYQTKQQYRIQTYRIKLINGCQNNSKNQDLETKTIDITIQKIVALYGTLIQTQNQPLSQQFIDYTKQQIIKLVFDIHKVFFVSLFYILNNYSSFIVQQGKLIRFDRQRYAKLFQQNQEQIKFTSQIVKTMMFVRLCQFHIKAEKQLTWNQNDICSLFVYCHYIIKQNQEGPFYWSIKNISTQQEQSIINSTNKQILNAQKLNEYINYVIKKNVKQLSGSLVQNKIYKVEHYLIKYLSYLNYLKPGIVTTLQKEKEKENQGWFQWIMQLIKLENVQKQEKLKKEKLNNLHDFWQGNKKKILNLKCLYKDIGSENQRKKQRKNFVLQGWNQNKQQIMSSNRQNVASSKSLK